MQSIPKQPGVLGIDVGTSGMKMAFYDFEGNEILSTREEYPTYYPYPGWIEQSPEDWWNAVIHGLDTFWKRNLNPQQIVAIGLSGQMENCLLLDQSGNPLHRVLLYSDSRATVEADLISRRIGKKRIQQIFGNRIDHATTVAKLLWIKRHHPEWYHLAKTVVSGAKDFIIFRFTNQYVTDPTNASTTGSMNILSRQWEKAIIEDIGLSSSLFPYRSSNRTGWCRQSRRINANWNHCWVSDFLWVGGCRRITVRIGSGRIRPFTLLSGNHRMGCDGKI